MIHTELNAMKKHIAILLCLLAAVLQARSLFINPAELSIRKDAQHLYLFHDNHMVVELHTEPFGKKPWYSKTDFKKPYERNNVLEKK